MSNVTESVEVGVPVSTAYNQWTQFEEFPRFMEGVEEIRQVSDTLTHWRVKLGGATREYDAQITEQIPDERVAWRSLDGPSNAGVVTFHRLGDARTRVTLQMEVDPDGAMEKAADRAGLIKRRARGDLERFQKYIESVGHETGAWRGEVNRPRP